MNKTIQTVESAAASGALYIGDVDPLIDGGRFPVKRVVGGVAAAIILRQCEAFLQTGSDAALQTPRSQGARPVIGFVKESIDQTNRVIVTIALSPEVHEFWLSIGDVEIGKSGDRRHVAALENLLTGDPIGWGGIGLRIDPEHDSALLFRCLA